MQNHDMRALHWLPERNRWEPIDWDAFLAFRELMVPFAPLPSVTGGIHYFVVVVADEEQTFNIIPHKYLVEPTGRIGADNFYGWTREEREDYSRLMIAQEFKVGEHERLRAIQEKAGNAMYPPKQSLYALAHALPAPPRESSAATQFLDAVAAGISRSELQRA